MCMDTTFTPEDYLRIKNEEEELLGSFSDTPVERSQYQPSQNTMNTILNFSKALSIRKSKSTEYIEVVLN